MGGSTKSLGFDVLPAATRVTQGFGCTDYNGEWLAPWCGAGFFHAGIDLAADDIFGKPVYATRAGVVVANQDPAHRIQQCAAIGGQVVFEPYLGINAVVVQVDEDGRRVWMEFGHLNSAAVRPGDRVEIGDVVGYVGTHGASCGSHLHLEVRTDGPWQGVAGQAAALLDPTPYLMGDDMNSDKFDEMLRDSPLFREWLAATFRVWTRQMYRKDPGEAPEPWNWNNVFQASHAMDPAVGPEGAVIEFIVGAKNEFGDDNDMPVHADQVQAATGGFTEEQIAQIALRAVRDAAAAAAKAAG